MEHPGFGDLVERSAISRDSVVVFYGYAPVMGFWHMKLFGHPEARVLAVPRTTWQREGRRWTSEVAAPTAARYPLPEQERRIRAWQPEVRRAIGDPGHVILDVRTEAEFGGERFWPSGGLEEGGRAGHVPSAAHLPAEDLLDADGVLRPVAEPRRIFAPLDLRDDQDVITYCTIGGRASTSWFALTYLLGPRTHPRVRRLVGGVGPPAGRARHRGRGHGLSTTSALPIVAARAL